MARCSTAKFGDVVCRRGGIKPFAYGPDSEAESTELNPMGPMPGGKMVTASGDAQRTEQQMMARLELSDEDFARNSKLAPGTRRKYVEIPRNVSAALQSDGSLQLKFELSSGAFATVLLAEICGELI